MGSVQDIRQLKKVFNDHIYSIIKYGFGKRNLLVILKTTEMEYLLRIKPYVQRLKKEKNILVLSEDNFKLPLGIDFLNIKLTSAVLYGQDIFTTTTIENTQIKRQLKYESNKLAVALRNELLSLKWGFQYKRLLYSMVPRILPLIVAHLYLLGEKIPNAIPDTINRYVKHNEDAVVFLKIKKTMDKKDVFSVFEEIIAFLEDLSRKV